MNKINTTSFVSTLPAETYYCSEQYNEEFNKIFKKEWIYAMHESQLPELGSYDTFEMGSVPLLIVRGQDDVIRAFYNVCVHRGHILATGNGTAKNFVCPYHAWTYQTDGTLRGVPGAKVSEMPTCTRSLRGVETRIRDGFIFVRLEEGEDDFDEKFGGFFDELNKTIPNLEGMRFVRRYKEPVKCNWKIMVENYLECYHCSQTHPALAELIDLENFKISQHEYYLTTSAPAGSPDNSAFSYKPRKDMQKQFTGWGLWPNSSFNIFPGQDNILIFHMVPSASEETYGYCDFFFRDGVVDEEAAALMDWEVEVLETEDNDLIMSAQLGMKSGALDHGTFILDTANQMISEAPLAHFNYMVQRALNGHDAMQYHWQRPEAPVQSRPPVRRTNGR
ncbi:MAG: aromatic ring-hydroxylating dioxygenase subunit alpha [Hyphomicrobiales bacterium]